MITDNITTEIGLALEADLSEHGAYRIVTTVRHTGTHSIKEQFPGYKHWHCNPTVWQLIEANPTADVIVTYRDPLRTAASWYNRTQLPPASSDCKSPVLMGMIFSWKEAWEYYGKIIKVIPDSHIYRMEDLDYKLYTHADGTGAHSLLDAGDIDGFHQLVSKELTDFAFNQIHSIGASNDRTENSNSRKLSEPAREYGSDIRP